jgi:hypothetical protein
MASFQKDAFGTPFGRNEFMRSTEDVLTISRSLARMTVPAQTIDGFTGQKILQPGVVLATITSGPDAGKVGPFQGAGTDEIQVLTGGGTISGGTFAVTVMGSTTAAIAWNADAATLQAALRLAVASDSTRTAAEKAIADGLTVAGGPIASVPFTVTFNAETSADIAQMTVDVTNLTGAGHAITPSTSTPGVAGATDGRETLANIVGLNKTFLPWQLMDRDVEVAVIYGASVVQSKCLMLNASGSWVAVDDTTAAAMFGKKNLDIRFVS